MRIDLCQPCQNDPRLPRIALFSTRGIEFGQVGGGSFEIGLPAGMDSAREVVFVPVISLPLAVLIYLAGRVFNAIDLIQGVFLVGEDHSTIPAGKLVGMLRCPVGVMRQLPIAPAAGIFAVWAGDDIDGRFRRKPCGYLL